VPLAFHSLSHGSIAFGFFNIETDMLLLENYFFSAPSFCWLVSELAGGRAEESDKAKIPGYRIERAEEIGNLRGAILGTDLRGFIGHIYQLFPFPRRPEEFKQKPEGALNTPIVERLLSKWAQAARIPVELELRAARVRIAEFIFSREGFWELVAYVWRGGMPGWKDNVRPEYIIEMNRAIEKGKTPLFSGLKL
jgi:hypothetical protein